MSSSQVLLSGEWRSRALAVYALFVLLGGVAIFLQHPNNVVTAITVCIINLLLALLGAYNPRWQDWAINLIILQLPFGFFALIYANGVVPTPFAAILVMLPLALWPAVRGALMALLIALLPLSLVVLRPEDIGPVFSRIMVTDLGVTLLLIVVFSYVRRITVRLEESNAKLINKQQDLEEQIQKFDSLSLQANLIFWQYDLSTKEISYNRAFALRWKLTPGATISLEAMGAMMSEHIFAMHKEAITRVVETKERQTRRFRATKDEYQGQWHNIQYWPVLNKAEEVTAVNAANINVTDLVETETQLQSTLDRQKELFAIVGHEMRTPVAAINMLCEDSEQSAQSKVEHIHQISESLLHVLEDMRIVVSPERALESKQVLANPAQIIERSLASLRPLATELGFTLVTHAVTNSGLNYQLNAQALRQIVINLVKNAALHSGGDTIEIGLSFEVNEATGEVARLTIDDNGTGIPSYKIDEMFEPFKQGNSSNEGSGLGLYIVSQLATRLGGTLEYSQSSLGGACFTLVFPIGQPIDQTLAQQEAIKDSCSLTGLRILLAEDEKVLRMLTDRMLTGKGAVVTTCVDGQEALEAFNCQDFDLVITDLMMPRMDGHQLTTSIRSTDRHTPVIAVTAAVLGKETDRFIEEGANAVLPKPLTIDNLCRALADIKLNQ